ncbi:MAG: ABC transporter permease [Bacteroidales bacterium]
MASPAILPHFKNNKLAAFSAAYLFAWLFLAIFAYLFIPDATTNANFQLVEVGKQAPFSQAVILKVPILPSPKQPNLFQQIVTGKTQDATAIPLQTDKSIEIKEGKLHFVRKNGIKESLSLEKWGDKSLSLVDLQEKYVETRTFFLGTDGYGRDVLSRLILGARVSLTIGILAALLSVLIGTLIGIMAGYWGGVVDKMLMWLVSVVWAIPTLLMAIVLGFVLGTGFFQLLLAISLSVWVEVARMVRGQVLSVKNLLYIEATQAMGFPAWRVMFKHLLPNVLTPIIILTVANFGSAILIESGMSFLGLGLDSSTPTWGRMVYEGYTFIVFAHGKWLAIFPGLALVSMVVAINLLGNALNRLNEKSL